MSAGAQIDWSKYAAPGAAPPQAATPQTAPPAQIDFSKYQSSQPSTAQAAPQAQSGWTPSWEPSEEDIKAHPYLSALAQEGRTDLNEAEAKAQFAKDHPWINAVGDILSTAIVPSGEALADAMPSTARAAANLNKVSQAVGDAKLPIPQSVSDATDNVLKLASQGGQKPKVVSDFMEYATNPDKGLAWNDLRRFQSIAGRRVFLDNNSQVIKDPVMLRSLGQFYGSLRDWAMDVADSKGVLEPFEQGLKEYGQAKGAQDTLRTVTKTAVPAVIKGAAGAAGAGGVYGAGKTLWDLVFGR